MSTENSKYFRDERRAALLDTARRVFLKDGYNTSMEVIATRHGGSKTTLYKYFSSKSELFNAIVEEQSARIGKELNVFSGKTDDIRSVLKTYVSRFLSIMLSQEMIAFERLITAEAVRFPETARAAYEIGIRPGLQNTEKLIHEAIEAGQLRDVSPNMATIYLHSLCDGLLTKMRLWGIEKDATTAQIAYDADAIVAIFLAAFGNDKLAQTARQFTGK